VSPTPASIDDRVIVWPRGVLRSWLKAVIAVVRAVTRGAVIPRATAFELATAAVPRSRSRLAPKLISGFQSEAPGIPHRAKRGKEFAAMRPLIVSIPSVLKMLRDPIRPWQGPSLGMCVEQYAESFHAIGPLEHGAIPLLFSPTHLLARYPSPVDKIGRVEIEPATDFLCHAAFLFLGVGERSGLRHDAKS
jgi:hypothetical protein